MNSRVVLLTVLTGLSIAGSTVQAEQLTYNFTGYITSTSGSSASTVTQLQGLGVGVNTPIGGTISFDDDAPGSIAINGGVYTGTVINMSTTFFVHGTGIDYDLGPNKNDRIGTHQAIGESIWYDSIGFSRDLQYPVNPSMPDTGLTAPTGEAIRAAHFELSITNSVYNALLTNSWLEDFRANFPTMTGASGNWKITGSGSVTSSSLSLSGKITSFTPVPEPSALALAIVGGLGLTACRLRRRSAA